MEDSTDNPIPDESWTEFESNMKGHFKNTPQNSNEDYAEGYTEDADEDTDEDTDEDADEDADDRDTSSLTTDQVYLKQKQLSAPRCLPKFSNDFIVYEPKEPKLQYATRPGPNSYKDILSERAHVETKEEAQRANEAQRSAQERHEDLLRRSNWVFIQSNRKNSDSILKQPKMIPGPANQDKYSRRYSKYSLA